MTGSPSRPVAVATDFSDGASVALARAVELARFDDRELVLLHCLSFTGLPSGSPDPIALSSELERRVRDASRARLEREVSTLASSGLTVHGELVTSESAAHAVLDASRRLDAEVLVVGTRGLSGLPNVLLGSVARQLIRHSDRPVLTVHETDERPLGSIRTVLVPSDFSDDATHAARAVGDMLAPIARDVRVVLATVLHVPAPLRAILGDLSIAPATLGQTPDDLREALEPVAEALRKQGFTTETLCRVGQPSKEIVEIAQLAGADLIAMGTRGRSGLQEHLLGSTAERVIQQAACPVLAVPLPAENRRPRPGAAGA